MIRLILLSLALSANAWASPLQVVTFNMKWFGLGGGIAGSIGDEFRDSWIVEFSQTPMGAGFLSADVLVLQEVVEPARLKRLLPAHFCQSYEFTDRRHQFVVVCLKNGMRFEKDGGDDNFALEESATGDLRPAVHGLVTDAVGTARFHLIGVHLKAGRDESVKRVEQMKKIKEFIDTRLTDGVPVLLTGDFNAYEENGDHASFASLLADKLLPVASDRTTYRSFSRARKFDMFYVSPGLIPAEPPYVPDICQLDYQGRVRFHNLDFYSQMVSDHCPVKITLPAGAK
jgi:hypothetical protein